MTIDQIMTMNLKLQTGKLYKCPNHFLLLFPTKENADEGVNPDEVVAFGPAVQAGVLGGDVKGEQAKAAGWANYWSNKLDCRVQYIEPNEVFMTIETIEEEDNFIKILSRGKNWLDH